MHRRSRVSLAMRRSATRGMSRRSGIQRLALLSVGLTAAGCTPLKIALRLYPEDFDRDPGLVQRVLRGFVSAVVPTDAPEGLEAVRALRDPFYPMARYAAFFASDLCRRAFERFGRADFEQLDLDRRGAVIEDGLQQGGVTGRLYGGAVFLVQVAFYSGAYRSDGACPEIGFEGRYRFRGLEATTYPDPQRFLAREISHYGNPA